MEWWELISRYSVGDTIQAECVSPLSVPPASLTWYVNSSPVDTGYVTASGGTETGTVVEVEVMDNFSFHVSHSHSGDWDSAAKYIISKYHWKRNQKLVKVFCPESRVKNQTQTFARTWWNTETQVYCRGKLCFTGDYFLISLICNLGPGSLLEECRGLPDGGEILPPSSSLVLSSVRHLRRVCRSWNPQNHHFYFFYCENLEFSKLKTNYMYSCLYLYLYLFIFIYI